jgi:hypothetical protein
VERLKQSIGPMLSFGILLCVVLAAYSRFHTSEAAAPKAPGWEELVLCSILTSIDSKKSLTLSDDYSAELTDDTKSGDAKTSKGHWSLLNAERHMYKIDVAGAAGTYAVVSPPDAEGCMLAAGGLNYVDLRRSWFSVRVDPADLVDHP